MRKELLLGLLLFITVPIFAQEVQWAYNVLGYSTQKDSKAFSAKQALGKHNVLPGSGENVNAWQPKDKGVEEFIKVGFLVPVKPRKIYIAESFNPGFISKVYVYDASGQEHEVASFQPKAVADKSRLTHISTSLIDFYVFAVKVVVKPSKELPVAIDAIGISESDKVYEVKMNHADVIKSNMVVTRLDKAVNSKFPEHGPLLSPDGKTLYFSRSFDPKNVGGADDPDDIWYSEWDAANNKWGDSKNTGIPFNNKDPNFINSISPDGNTLLLGNAYSPDGKTVAGGASITFKTATGWTTPMQLQVEEDQNVNERSNYYLSNSQKVLLMSVERKKETYGDRDLYVSFMKADSTWAKPLNLGAVVNTLGTEAAPFLASDDKTLYFSSTGHEGYGGSDIYVTRRLDDTWTKWSVPENLGPIVNTSNDESYFSLSADGEKVYYTSKGEAPDDVDIYTLSLPEIVKPLPVVVVKGRVLSSEDHQPLPGVRIFFENLATGKEMGVAKSNPENSTYEIMLPSGSDYGFLAEKAGYISVNANMDLRNLKEYEEITKDLYLTPIETGKSIVLNNVFFQSKSITLEKQSHLELDRLIKLMKTNATMKVEVSGHTDNIGSESYNDFLSFQRAKAVAAYITTHGGFGTERISVQYYGEGKPVADNNTAEGRQLNRRVEFLFLSK